MTNENKKIIFSTENPGGILVDMTTEELAIREQDSIKAETQKTIEAQKEANAKSGNQKFLDMGLTQEEATALTGYKPPEEEE